MTDPAQTGGPGPGAVPRLRPGTWLRISSVPSTRPRLVPRIPAQRSPAVGFTDGWVVLVADGRSEPFPTAAKDRPPSPGTEPAAASLVLAYEPERRGPRGRLLQERQQVRVLDARGQVLAMADVRPPAHLRADHLKQACRQVGLPFRTMPVESLADLEPSYPRPTPTPRPKAAPKPEVNRPPSRVRAAVCAAVGLLLAGAGALMTATLPAIAVLVVLPVFAAALVAFLASARSWPPANVPMFVARQSDWRKGEVQGSETPGASWRHPLRPSQQRRLERRR